MLGESCKFNPQMKLKPDSNLNKGGYPPLPFAWIPCLFLIACVAASWIPSGWLLQFPVNQDGQTQSTEISDEIYCKTRQSDTHICSHLPRLHGFGQNSGLLKGFLQLGVMLSNQRSSGNGMEMPSIHCTYVCLSLNDECLHGGQKSDLSFVA